jgi:hypothetical protein
LKNRRRKFLRRFLSAHVLVLVLVVLVLIIVLVLIVVLILIFVLVLVIHNLFLRVITLGLPCNSIPRLLRLILRPEYQTNK